MSNDTIGANLKGLAIWWMVVLFFAIGSMVANVYEESATAFLAAFGFWISLAAASILTLIIGFKVIRDLMKQKAMD